MAKFCGKIGYGIPTEIKVGVWSNTIVEKLYYGDIVKNVQKFQTIDKVNDDITIANNVSILSDSFALENCKHMVYVELFGSLWKVSSVEIKYPRMELTIGGLYNG